MTKLKHSAFLLLLAMTCAAPAVAQDQDDDRRDVTIGNPDRMRSGKNQRGDNEMVIERKPKAKQEMPNMGPMYVVPQVNRGGTNTPVIIPVQPPRDQRNAPQDQPGTPQPGQP